MNKLIKQLADRAMEYADGYVSVRLVNMDQVA